MKERVREYETIINNKNNVVVVVDTDYFLLTIAIFPRFFLLRFQSCTRSRQRHPDLSTHAQSLKLIGKSAKMFVPISIWTVVLLSCILTIHAAQKSVLLYSKVNQFQLVTSNTLVWQSYTDERDLEFAVRAAKYSSEKEGYNQYVCRVITEGIYVPGHTQNRDSHILCVVSMHTNVETHRTFDVLLNKGNGAKLSWKPWSKFSATIPTGAVSASDSSGHVSFVKLINFIVAAPTPPPNLFFFFF